MLKTNFISSIIKKPSIFLILTLIFTFIGFILRVVNLSELSIWLDEFIHINRAKNYVDGISSLYISNGDNNGIFFSFIISVFFKLFNSDPFWARFPSVIFGTLSIYYVYLLGKKLYNRYVGLIAAFINVFSLYLIYWSRLSRNYTIFEWFYLLMLIILFNMFEPRYIKSKFNYLSNINVDLKVIISFIIVFIFSFFSHQLTFFVLFGIAFYLGMMGVITIIKGIKDSNFFKYVYIGIPLLVLMLLVFMPFLSGLLKAILSLMLPEKAVEWVVPDWIRIAQLFAEKPYESFMIYWNVFEYDYKIPLLVIALGGLILGFIKQFKSTFFLSAFLVIPFLLMSFVFREPALARYAIYLVPLVGILIGSFFYNIYSFLTIKFKAVKSKRVSLVLAIIPFVIIASQFRYKEIKSVSLVEKKVGYIVDKKISQWAFANFADPAKYVLKYAQPGDIILSTNKNSADYYLHRKDVIQFRQKFLNTKTKAYELYKPDAVNLTNAKHILNIKHLYAKYKRGWLIADYYFDNVMTDVQAKNWVFKNMNYHPDATEDGTVMIFSWDKTRSIPSYQNFVVDVGKSEAKTSSADYILNINKKSAGETLTLCVAIANVDTDREAWLILNKVHQISIPKNSKPQYIELRKIEVDSRKFEDGPNSVFFFSNYKASGDVNKGFIAYNLYIE